MVDSDAFRKEFNDFSAGLLPTSDPNYIKTSASLTEEQITKLSDSYSEKLKEFFDKSNDITVKTLAFNNLKSLHIILLANPKYAAAAKKATEVFRYMSDVASKFQRAETPLSPPQIVKKTTAELGSQIKILKESISKLQTEIDNLKDEINSKEQLKTQTELLTKQTEDLAKLTQIVKIVNVFKWLMHTVLNRSSFNYSTLEKWGSPHAIEYLIADIEKYRAKLTSQVEVFDAQQLGFIIDELSNANQIANDKIPRPYLANAINTLISFLNSPQQHTVFPGGCRGHVVLYQIEKAADGTYSLTIFNTDPPDQSAIPRDRRTTIPTLKYTGLTIEDLSSEFIEKLISREKYASMKDVHSAIEESFKDKAHIKSAISGPEIRHQQKDTCTMECLLAWLEYKMGPEKFLQFTSHMQQNAIASAEQEAKNLTEYHKIVIFGDKDYSAFPQLFAAAQTELKKTQASVAGQASAPAATGEG